MPVDTYAKLQSALADTANDDSLFADVTAFSPTQIDGAVKRAIAYSTAAIERDLIARGGHKSMETITNSLTTTASQETMTLPTGFKGVRLFALTSSPYRILEFVDPNTLFTQYPFTTTGQPEKYTLIAGVAYLRPIPDQAYTTRLIYNAALDVLSDTTTTNWLLTGHPDIYLSAGMVELCIYLENDDRLQFWRGFYDQKMNDLMGDDRQVRWAAVPSKPSLQVQIA